jgi:hypothetical protein
MPSTALTTTDKEKDMNYPQSTATRQIFQDGEKYYMVEIYPDGKIILKVKENGWGDTWSLPVEPKSWGED